MTFNLEFKFNYIILNTFDIIATTLFGLEELLASELRELGVTDIEILNRAVRYKGDLALLYKSNYSLRTALKILKPIASFDARNEQKLYEEIRKIRWDEFITPKQTLAIDGTTSGEVFTHSKYVALKSKDAIVDQFRDKYGVRPSVDTENPDLQINIHIYNTTCSVSLDSSGTNLGKRGYRQSMFIAPLSEVLAAGIILLSGWDKQCNFLDPMCGSGTIPIEAALIAGNIPPGRLRHFGFEKWNDFNSELWYKIKKEADSKIIPFKFKITGKDNDKEAIEVSIQNAKRAGMENMITFEQQDFLKSDSFVDNTILILNPPYGERLKEKEEIIPFYKEIGTKLKHFYMGCDAWIISGNLEAIKFIGLKPSRKIKIFNGPIECKLHKYELYKGSNKSNK